MQKLLLASSFIVSIVLCSCASTRTINDDTNIIIANQRAIQRLETATADLGKLYTRTTTRVDNIRREASRIGDSIDRLAFLFDQYDREVVKLLAEIERIRAQTVAESQDNSNTANNTDN